MMVLIVTIKIIIIILIIECVYNDANGPIVMIRAHYRNQSLIVLGPLEAADWTAPFYPQPCPRAPRLICIKSVSSERAMQLPRPRSPGDGPATDDATPHLTH